MAKYWFDGITASEQEIHEKEGTPVNKYYGNPQKKWVYRWDQDPPKWEIWVGAGLKPEFYKEPVELNREEFAQKMKELGVSDELILKYFATEGGFKEGD